MTKLEDKYLNLILKEYGLQVVVKMDDEGIVLDVWKDKDVIATTWKMYDEFGVEVKELEDDNTTKTCDRCGKKVGKLIDGYCLKCDSEK